MPINSELNFILDAQTKKVARVLDRMAGIFAEGTFRMKFLHFGSHFVVFTLAVKRYV